MGITPQASRQQRLPGVGNSCHHIDKDNGNLCDDYCFWYVRVVQVLEASCSHHTKQTPNWQPISKLPPIALMNEGDGSSAILWDAQNQGTKSHVLGSDRSEKNRFIENQAI